MGYIGIIGYILWLYRDDGEENGNYSGCRDPIARLRVDGGHPAPFRIPKPYTLIPPKLQLTLLAATFNGIIQALELRGLYPGSPSSQLGCFGVPG